MRSGLGKKGQTLYELILAAAISSVLLAAITAFYQPLVSAFAGIVGSNNMRTNVAGALNSLQMDASNMYAVYVDPTQCYAVCMVDGNGNRISYWWDKNATGNIKNLYRKKEASTNPISCTNGAVFATGLDSTKTTFAMNKDELLVNFTAGTTNTVGNGTAYSLTTGIFPSIQERQIIFSEGFECDTLRQGWVVNNGAKSSWSIAQGAHQGDYQIAAAEGSGGGSSTTTIQIAIDLSRVSNAHASFMYMNDGNISATNPADTFILQLYDGTTWQTVFTDNSGTLLSSPRAVNVDLSSYALNQLNQIKFSGALKNAGSHWYVDSIQIFQP